VPSASFPVPIDDEDTNHSCLAHHANDLESRRPAPRRGRRRLVAAVCAASAGVACSPDQASPPATGATTGTVVVGLTTDLRSDDDGFHALRAVQRVDGAVVRDEVWSTSSVELPLRFPAELRFEGLPDRTPVDVRLSAFTEDVAGADPFLLRLAATRVTAGRVGLLRVPIERDCIPNLRLQGDLLAPTCAEPETCVAAACTTPFVAPDRLEEYTPTWASSFADACKPLDPGPPTVEIGGGEDAYVPVEDGGPMRIERGPQGGLHVWIGVRVRNLHQRGSVTTLSAAVPSLGLELDPMQVALGFDGSPGGTCELHALRYVVASRLSQLDALIGASLRIDAKVVDVTGTVGLARKTVTLTQ
jgi:hypothetical protein